MTDMIERVARALCENHIRTVRFWDTLPQRLNEMMPQSVDDNWQEFIPQAIAAIKAMREPTDDMVEAAGKYADENQPFTFEDFWRVMIDAALGE